MRRRTACCYALLIIFTVATTGCSSGLGFSKMNPFAKSEQWEPEVEEAKTDWRSDAGKIGRGNRRAEKQDPLDKILWSDQAKDINRNMGFN